MDEFGLGHTEMGLPANTLLLNRYKIHNLLGAGGMGRVYLAEDQKLGIPVAIKVLRDILTQDPASVKRLITEAKTSILLAYPNIVRLHNFEDGETTKFLVMEYVEGETLDEKIARQGKLSEGETRSIAIEICKGLEHAHQKKVIHRDMKPGNVLLGKDGSVKISDFGLARLCHDSIARLTSQLSAGTLQYMSPEQLDGEISELSDQYSVGVMLYEMLSGSPPFVTGDLLGQIRRKIPKPLEGVSPGMNRLVLKCLEKNKENRFPSVRELREELDGTVGQRDAQLKEAEQHLELLQASAENALNGAKYAEAIALWEQALALKPGDPTLAASLQRARELLNNAPKVKPPAEDQRFNPDLQRLEPLRAKAKEAFNAGRYGDAISMLQEALTLSPGDAGLNAAISEARRQADRVTGNSAVRGTQHEVGGQEESEGTLPHHGATGKPNQPKRRQLIWIGIPLLVVSGLALIYWLKPAETSIQRFQVSRQEIVAGETVTLSWNVEGSARIEITPGLGAVAKSGEQTLSPKVATMYTLRATDPAGKVYQATSRVEVRPKPLTTSIQRLQLSRQEIVAGEKVTLSWNVEGPAKVEIMPGLGAVAKAGEQTLTPSEDTMYTLRATDSAGKVYEARSRVAVRPKPESFVVHHFSVEPQEIRAGQTATLTWQTSGATAVEIQPGIGSVGPSGSRQIAPPPGKTVYTIVARGNPPEKSELRQVQISVGRGGGTIIWEGNIRGSEMVDIDINKASSGQLTGGLPGAPCIIQSVEPQNVRVLIRPSPENRYLKLRLLVIGNGHTRVVVTWAFQ